MSIETKRRSVTRIPSMALARNPGAIKDWVNVPVVAFAQHHKIDYDGVEFKVHQERSAHYDEIVVSVDMEVKKKKPELKLPEKTSLTDLWTAWAEPCEKEHMRGVSRRRALSSLALQNLDCAAYILRLTTEEKVSVGVKFAYQTTVTLTPLETRSLVNSIRTKPT